MPGTQRGDSRDSYAQAVRFVMTRAADGFKLSEVTPFYRRVAKQLVDQNKLCYTHLPSGDGLISRK